MYMDFQGLGSAATKQNDARKFFVFPDADFYQLTDRDTFAYNASFRKRTSQLYALQNQF